MKIISSFNLEWVTKPLCGGGFDTWSVQNRESSSTRPHPCPSPSTSLSSLHPHRPMIDAMASTAALSLFPAHIATDGVVPSPAKYAFFPGLVLPRAASRRSLPAATVLPRCAVAGGAGVQGMEEEEEVGESARPSRRVWSTLVLHCGWCASWILILFGYRFLWFANHFSCWFFRMEVSCSGKSRALLCIFVSICAVNGMLLNEI